MMTKHPSQIRSRLEFSDSESWRAYVESNVAPEERAYVTAFGLTLLYMKFYEVRNLPAPMEFARELERLQTLEEPARTDALSALNARIFADMTRLMIRVAPADRQASVTETPRQVIGKLLVRLEKQSPAFAIWCGYKRAQLHASRLPEWPEYVHALLPSSDNDDIEFILLMGNLGEVLRQLQDQNCVIDALTKVRICAVQRERAGAERNLAARLLVHELIEALAPCASA